MATIVNRVIWWCMVSALFIYAIVAYVTRDPTNSNFPVFIPLVVLSAISVGIAIGTTMYRRHALVVPIQRGDLDLTSSEGQAKAYAILFPILALSEAVGIFGLILVFMSGRSTYYAPFAIAALVLLYINRPTAPDLNPTQR